MYNVNSFDDSGMSDRDLIARYRCGDGRACTVLLARYANLINRRVRNVSIAGVDNDDLRQEAYMGLFNAVRTYDPAKNASFQTYAGLCVGNSLKNLFAAASTHKAKAQNQTVPIDELQDVDLRGKDDSNPEDIFLDKEACERLHSLINGTLSQFERDVLFSYLSGRGYQEVAVRLGSSQKSVDNALQRARRKLKAVLNKM